MNSHPYGAHEVIELHEVINGAIDAITTAHLYVPFIRDPELAQLVHHQLQFMQGEYNGLVYTVQGLGAGELLPYRPQQPLSSPGQMAAQPVAASQPHPYASQIHDRDVASALLGLHKAGAKTKMAAALEAAHPQIRDLLLQGAVNCAHQAYELWGYMQRKGYDTWAVMPQATNAELLRGYQPLRSEPQRSVSPEAAPMQTDSESGSIPQQLLREGANTVRTAPAVEQPLTPVNAHPVISPPPFQQHGHGETETTVMATDIVQTTGVEASDALYQQTDGRQPRSRKKNTISDTLLGQ